MWAMCLTNTECVPKVGDRARTASPPGEKPRDPARRLPREQDQALESARARRLSGRYLHHRPRRLSFHLTLTLVLRCSI